MTHQVLVTDKVAVDGLHPITDDESFLITSIDDSSSADFGSALAKTDALIVRSVTQVTVEMLERAPELKAVGRAGVGVDNVDLGAASERGIAVYNAPGGNTIAAAELTVGLMLSVARKIPWAHGSVVEGRWERAMFKGVELQGKTLGLIGAGRIGGAVATRCQAFGMNVIIYDPYLSVETAREYNATLVGLDQVFETADFISIHVPLSSETRGICGAHALETMKPTAFVINASRGGVVDEEALAAALIGGDIAGAALDVYGTEPLPESSPLREAPNLVLTPHLGASTEEAQLGVATEVAEKIRTQLTTGDTRSAINAMDL